MLHYSRPLRPNTAVAAATAVTAASDGGERVGPKVVVVEVWLLLPPSLNNRDGTKLHSK